MRIRKKRKKNLREIKIAAAFACLLALLFCLDAQLRPVIQTIAGTEAKTYAVQAINDAVSEELTQESLRYENLVRLTYSEAGSVTALQTDIMSMNILQSNITSRIVQEILSFDDQTIGVPIGTLLGGPLFSGRGPDVEIKIIPASFIETQIVNRFDSAGINQTRHQIFLNVKLTISAVIPGYSVTSDVNTNVLLAETVIVGTVPEAFTEVSDGTDPLVGMIQDYGAEGNMVRDQYRERNS